MKRARQLDSQLAKSLPHQASAQVLPKSDMKNTNPCKYHATLISCKNGLTLRKKHKHMYCYTVPMPLMVQSLKRSTGLSVCLLDVGAQGHQLRKPARPYDVSLFGCQ